MDWTALSYSVSFGVFRGSLLAPEKTSFDNSFLELLLVGLLLWPTLQILPLYRIT